MAKKWSFLHLIISPLTSWNPERIEKSVNENVPVREEEDEPVEDEGHQDEEVYVALGDAGQLEDGERAQAGEEPVGATGASAADDDAGGGAGAHVDHREGDGAAVVDHGGSGDACKIRTKNRMDLKYILTKNITRH